MSNEQKQMKLQFIQEKSAKKAKKKAEFYFQKSEYARMKYEEKKKFIGKNMNLVLEEEIFVEDDGKYTRKKEAIRIRKPSDEV